MNITSLSERYFDEKPHLELALLEWEQLLGAEAQRIDSGAVVTGRVKTYRSFLGKAYRKAGTVRTWDQFGDLVALKAVFPTTRGVQEFADWLLGREDWAPVLDEKESSPAELKYRAKQFDLAAPGITDSKGIALKIEVQVRTAASDAWYVVDHRLQYKGTVELTSDLKRKLNRLIVLAELFDEEVEAVIARQAGMPEYAVARLYEGLVKHSEALFGDHTRTSRPEGLLELLLSAYGEEEVSTISQALDTFIARTRAQLIPLVEQHHYGSATYVEHRDWIYYEPETLLIAERSSSRPSLLRATVAGSDFEQVITPMLAVFAHLRKT